MVTNPDVSPICRDDRQIQKNYHVADGGYFDNSGFVTAVEWLMELLKTNKNSKQITELKQLWRDNWQMTEKILD
jgi:hypothetical protein